MPSSAAQPTDKLTVRLARTAIPVADTQQRAFDLEFVKRAGLVVFAAQLVALLVWSALEASRHVQTGGFVGFYQSWYLIAHGNLNPNNWWQSQAVLVQYPLALLALISSSAFMLLAVQDVAIVGAELVAFWWICDLVQRRADLPVRGYCLTGVALLAFDPWIYWSASWDYHSEAIGTLFAVMAARELFRGRRIAALWCAVTLLSGMIPATYLVGIGISLLVAQRRRLLAAAVAGSSVAWFATLTLLGAGTSLGYANLGDEAKYQHGLPIGGLSTRASDLIQMVSHHGSDLITNLMPAGFVGAFTAPVFGVVAVVFGENFSEGNTASVIPSFQSLPLYIFVPVGSIIALIWVRRRVGPHLANIAALVLVANAIIWGAVEAPRVFGVFLSVNARQAAAIDHVQATIPQGESVIVSEGISGAFANREHIQTFDTAPVRLRLSAPYTWFVVAPTAGSESATPAQTEQLLRVLRHDPAARLVYTSAGISAFRVHAHSSRTRQYLPVPGKR
jgi:hypothetical protein